MPTGSPNITLSSQQLGRKAASQPWKFRHKFCIQLSVAQTGSRNRLTPASGDGWRQLTDSGPWNWGLSRGRGQHFLIMPKHHGLLSVEEGGKRAGPPDQTVVFSNMEGQPLMGCWVPPHFLQPLLQPQTAFHRRCLWTPRGEHVTPFTHFISCLEKPTCDIK